MKQVMEHFGGAVIAVLVAAVLLGIWYGLPRTLGELLETSVFASDYGESKPHAFTEYRQEDLPEIVRVSAGGCKAGVWNVTGSFIRAEDAAGKYYPVYILSGRHETIPEAELKLAVRGTKFYCTHPGVYWVSACYTMSNGRSREVLLRLVVNEEVTA